MAGNQPILAGQQGHAGDEQDRDGCGRGCIQVSNSEKPRLASVTTAAEVVTMTSGGTPRRHAARQQIARGREQHRHDRQQRMRVKPTAGPHDEQHAERPTQVAVHRRQPTWAPMNRRGAGRHCQRHELQDAEDVGHRHVHERGEEGDGAAEIAASAPQHGRRQRVRQLASAPVATMRLRQTRS
jgi:hypothetical protein